MTRNVPVIVHVFCFNLAVSNVSSQARTSGTLQGTSPKFMVTNGGSDGEGIPLIRGTRATRRNTPKTISKWGSSQLTTTLDRSGGGPA